MPKWTGSWAGGRTYQNKEGETVYQLERSVSGVRYSIKLEVGSERAALAELALFDRDPVGYRAQVQSAGAPQGSAVFLDAETVQGFLLHLASKERSGGYRRDARTYLSQWAEVLARRDLRTVTLLELRRALSQWSTARKMRIITLKSFFSWLREEDRIKASEDPTLALKVPPAVAEKGVRTKGYTMAQVEKLYAAVNSQVVRDVLCLRAKTGMHNSEIERLASGKGELRVINDPSGIAGTARFLHKNGRVHIISLDAQGLAAAQRLQARGAAPGRNTVRESIGYASVRAGQSPLNPGELRHSFATWAKNEGTVVKATRGGVPLDVVASVLGHQSSRTTSKFYDGTEVPPLIAIPLKLYHPQDPVAMQPRSGSAGQG
ncbi:tyrosine-type recombinase/integrase [Archangium lipolyticum]|uniref:tyrosine-type recombinase/integrase n=1 Tax=Archangium lipolyticum TaxID=2970465 RepID=UPI002149BD05|nr:site-specific integrase [Archangium lipolyticum]